MIDDPLAPSIESALRIGWRLLPQIGLGFCDNALVWTGDGWTDVVTIPFLGSSTVVRLLGGPVRPHQPRRTGREQWRRCVPVDVAVDWGLTGLSDDHQPRDRSER